MKGYSNIVCLLGNEALNLGINSSDAHALGDEHPPQKPCQQAMLAVRTRCLFVLGGSGTDLDPPMEVSIIPRALSIRPLRLMTVPFRSGARPRRICAASPVEMTVGPLVGAAPAAIWC